MGGFENLDLDRSRRFCKLRASIPILTFLALRGSIEWIQRHVKVMTCTGCTWDKHARSVAGCLHVHTVSTHESTYSSGDFKDHVSVVSTINLVSDTTDIRVLDTKA